MKILTNGLPRLLAVALVAPLVGCSGKPLLSNSGSDARQLPFDAIVVGPGERVSVDALPTRKSNVFCGNGAVLECERFGIKLNCSCPP